ncbi:MAG: PorT family protein [Bacteroidia bacterium]|nr:PorT family protein [Bacteroidia bacterium]
MLKRQCIVWITFLLIGSVYAQEGTFKIGVAVLPQNTWLLNQDDSDAGPNLDYEVTWGFAGGLTLGYNFSDYVGVGVDVLYSSQGQRYKGRDNGKDLTAQTTLNYLKVPLLFRFGSDPNSPVQFSFFIGPQANFLLSSRDNFKFSGSGVGSEVKVTGKEVSVTNFSPFGSVTTLETLDAPIYKSFTFGAAFGLGAGFKLSDALVLTLHFRGDYAFGDTENKEAQIPHGNHSHKYWEQKPKYYFTSHSSQSSERPATSAITGGFMLGLSYNIPVR